MSHIFKTTAKGKLDITINLLDKDKNVLFKNTSTYDIKPTIKEVINNNIAYSNIDNAYFAEIFSTPSFIKKLYRVN